MSEKILVKSKEPSSGEYGLHPSERKIQDIIKNGILIVDKPRGPTSHQVAYWVRDLLGLEKAGHSGTLDPAVSGVLVVALGEATKVLDYLFTDDKEYVSAMRLHSDVKENELREVLNYFTGELYQKPPLKSAVKRRLRTRTVRKIDLLEVDGKVALITVSCQAGTYIRKLIHDIGLVLGVGAHMQELRRTKAGSFTEAESVNMHQLMDAFAAFREEKDDSQLRSIIQPIEYAVRKHKKIWLKDSAVDAICHGAKLNMPGIMKLDASIKKGDQVALMTLKDELVALAQVNFSAKELMSKEHGVAADLKRVMMKPGVYPRTWKTRE